MCNLDNSYFAIYRLVAHGSTMHADTIGVSTDNDALDVLRVQIYNDLTDIFAGLPKDDNGHVSVEDLRRKRKNERPAIMGILEALQ